MRYYINWRCLIFMYCCIILVVWVKICVCASIASNDDIWNDTPDLVSGQAERTEQIDNIITEIALRNSKVLNFFPVPVEEECNASDGRRKGVCMNPYECRMQNGIARGSCALGFGVCCVFTATCDQDVYNNITYFVNPHFPGLTRDIQSCTLQIKRIEPHIAQLKLNFIHFNLGQPNRRTGVCEEDVFVLSGGSTRELTLCGINSGQHVFFNIDGIEEAIVIHINMSRKQVARLWEIRITQIPFVQQAPEGCLQYHVGKTGVLQTMNFAENGRHLANQDYNICMRQEEGMCSITYQPCDENSFKIGNAKPLVQHFQMMTEAPVASANITGETPETSGGSGDDVEGSGSEGLPVAAEPRRMHLCSDRIILPCDREDLLLPTERAAPIGYCSLAHCGSALCPHDTRPCRIESDVVPFSVGVQFGSASGREGSPEDNIGMCLIYEQQPCMV